MKGLVAVVAAASLLACKKDKGAPPGGAPGAPGAQATAELDGLWALAPEGAIGGVVVSSSGLARLEGAALAIARLADAAPELAAVKAALAAALDDALGTPTPSLAAAGMTAGKGAAFFAAPDGGAVVILPVRDRDKFIAVVEGTRGPTDDTIRGTTCRTVKGVYACARPAALLDRLGGGTLAARLPLAGARGDIEITGAIGARSPLVISFALQLARGAITLRGAVQGLPPEVTGKLVNAAPRLAGDRTAGFGVLHLGSLLAEVPPIAIAPGVSLAELAATIAGPLTATISSGPTPVYDVRLPVSDPAPAQMLVEQCDALPTLRMIGAKVSDGVCRIPLPQLMMNVDAWVEGGELRLGTKGAAPSGPAVALSPAGQELARGPWTFAFYGRGSIYGVSQMPAVPTGALPDEALMIVRGLSMLSEAGFGARVDGDTLRVLGTVRTAWSNPDGVIDALVAIPPRDLFENKASAAAQRIAEGAPGSPFAADFAAGYGGLMIQTAVIGVLAAVAIPAFLKYTRRSRELDSLAAPPADSDAAGSGAPATVEPPPAAIDPRGPAAVDPPPAP